jgi:hypothetical protein
MAVVTASPKDRPFFKDVRTTSPAWFSAALLISGAGVFTVSGNLVCRADQNNLKIYDRLALAMVKATIYKEPPL